MSRMRTVYLDAEYMCHAKAGPGLIGVDASWFDWMEDEVLAGYRYIPAEEQWTRADGVVFYGEAVFPVGRYDVLEKRQIACERQAARLLCGAQSGAVLQTAERMQRALWEVNACIPQEKEFMLRALYSQWDGRGVIYETGHKVLRGEQVYKCVQGHASQPEWTPEVTAALWQPVEEVHSGEREDPIPAAVGLLYEQGRYYVEDGAVYRYVWAVDLPLYELPSTMVDAGYFERIPAED